MVVGGKKLLFVMALEAEFGPRLRELITPFMTGVGPVEAGVMLGAELARLRSEDNLPDLVVSLGSAGSRTLQQAEIYQVASISYRDMDASVLGFEKGITPFLDLPATIPIELRIPGIEAARLSTGASIISGAGYDAIGADMVDMETFAILRACQIFDVPLVGLRGISDGASNLNHIDDWTRYLEIIDEKLAAAIGLLRKSILEGALVV
ncbi:5'-methylthioadenosine/S-adenosylhomocysteine nucleosidase [Pseudaminobacter arsenicus]|uniref:5'-methylthioadenosine/S-adenosylhomocysteine nucleosidase n=1 Tax=Borborobacter arsenicus TaxID=1851146 RepID=A0A432VAN0_9HYPH|nr:5'-methylthioadenosine/S-adenosylhomocysteine nucleosidase [Pseudaminobacter arsenicus]RUM99164.1 5'-methylthioadenosine/S-adenosylhomocysteine nucleosidase [Pseudaminobacter arsenicus]